MKLIRVTDTQGRVWHINRDWVLRISKEKKGTLIEFALLANGWTGDSVMTMYVKESVGYVKARLNENDMPMGREH